MLQGRVIARCDDCGEEEFVSTSGTTFEMFVSHASHGLWTLTDMGWGLDPVLCPPCFDRVAEENKADDARGDR